MAKQKVAGANFGPDWPGLRCGAHSRRSGKPCKNPAVTGKKRCRIHGGAKGSGAPRGQRNGAWKHGSYSQQGREWRAAWKIIKHHFEIDRSEVLELNVRLSAGRD